MTCTPLVSEDEAVLALALHFVPRGGGGGTEWIQSFEFRRVDWLQKIFPLEAQLRPVRKPVREKDNRFFTIEFHAFRSGLGLDARRCFLL